MFDLSIHSKQIEFRSVLMDTWYATRALMMHIERSGKIYYCLLQDNRQVDEGDGKVVNYRRVDSLSWSEAETLQGKNAHVKDFPKGHRLQAVPACGLKRPHGLCRNQRPDSKLNGCYTKGVCHSLED